MISRSSAMHSEPTSYNGRAVLDASTLRFDAAPGEGRWIVAKITPAPGTGEAWLLETLPHVGYRERGSWALLTSLEDGPVPAHGTYAWEQPIGASPYGLEPPELYDVF